ncbi:HXXEE domain-containing protein [Pelosinus baikalensis]|uniref:HXXEE domain-containing protein n=1 Tax=Pelosinus baikalensis TaxID=2892015 RepID=A0ABS8HVZ9_9FIRM|nr:HXXEE domain-containing protein [Pelosinus baikalensis]MCC5467340.1 HXXEE domain-containing protein [Pelosinus baikalensis]
MELLFLLSFTLHNIEEGIWLPRWSQYVGPYHPQVSNREFHFALLTITSVGYLLTFMSLQFGQSIETIQCIYLGFIVMMCLNSVFPHLLATIVLKKYAPGTLTGLLLNLPIGTTIIMKNIEAGVPRHSILIAGIIVSVLTSISLRLLFKMGSKLIDEY